MNDDRIHAALSLLERQAQPPTGMADALFARLVQEMERSHDIEPAPARPRRLPRPRLVPIGVAAALIALAAALITIVPQPPSAFATLQRAREQFERRPVHVTIRNVFGEFVGDDTLVVEHWFESETQWRATILSSANPNTPEEADDFTVFDGEQLGRFEIETDTFEFVPAAEIDDPYAASGTAVHDPTFGHWPSALGIKPTAQFLDENCRVGEDRIAGRAADKLTCDTGNEDIGREVGIWLDRESGFILKISTAEVVREVLRIEFAPTFPAGIFDVVAPEGSRARGAVPGKSSGPGPEATATIEVGKGILSVDAGLGAVWVVTMGGRTEDRPDRGDWQLRRIDPATNSVVATIPVEVGADVAVGEGFVWVTGGRGDASLRRLDPATNEFDSSIPLARKAGVSTSASVVVGAGGVWVITHSREETELIRVDPATDEVTRIPFEDAPYIGAPVFGAGSLWVFAQAFAPDGGPINRVYRLNERTYEVEATIRPSRSVSLAFEGGALWMLSGDDRGSMLTRIDPATNRIAATIGFPPGAAWLATDGGYLWVLNFEEGTLVKVDPATNQVMGPPIRAGRGGQVVAVGEGAAWVGTYKGKVVRIDVAL